MNNTIDIDKFYVSPYDKMFHGFDKTHKLSESQKREIAKHQRIAKLRDNADIADGDRAIWDKF
ncbi:CBU_0585 family protein [Legionella sp. W05-934-2]|jgi:hypothetical protein|uniref:CBU_0585 family protein n=1 Tax=Legionella sp. W05-934-2 TaxID=1198649 RepID=UPI003461BDFB